MGFLAGLFDGGQGYAKKKNEEKAAALMATLGQQYGFGISKWIESLKTLDDAKMNALGNLEDSGNQAKKAILEGGTQAKADVKQNLIDSGFSGGTVGAAAAAQVTGQTSDALAAWAEAKGAQTAQVQTTFGMAKSNALQGIADFAMKKVGIQADIMPTYEAAGGGIAGMLGQAAGSYLGGTVLPGIGGAIGGMFKKEED